MATYLIVQEVNLQHFLGRLVLFTYCYDKDRQSSHNAAICRIWRHSLFYAKFINLSYIKNLVGHFWTLFLFLPVSQGCYFQKVFYDLTSLSRIVTKLPKSSILRSSFVLIHSGKEGAVWQAWRCSVEASDDKYSLLPQIWTIDC